MKKTTDGWKSAPASLRARTALALGLLGVAAGILPFVRAEAPHRPASLAVGRDHALVARPDGSVWAWGENSGGQVGDGTQRPRTAPAALDVAGAVGVAAGRSHTLAVMSDGTVLVWGRRLGRPQGSPASPVLTPVSLRGVRGVTAVAAGEDHALVLKADGSVMAWGANESGQLGDDTPAGRATVAPVSGLAGVTAIAAGSRHSLALKADGTVWAWGRNADGQVGAAAAGIGYAPVQVGDLDGVVAIAGGGAHSLALRTDRTVWGWGSNRSGQLGDAWDASLYHPTQIRLEDVVAVAAGERHTLALRSDGSVWALGDNRSGQLGDRTRTESNIPLQVEDLPAVIAVAAGGEESLALGKDGSIWGWGGRRGGKLEDAATPRMMLPGLLAPTSTVATPTLTPGTGTYNSVQSVTVSCASGGAEIHYTTNGADPTLSDTIIASGGAVQVSQNLALKAKAWKTGMNPSAVGQATYTLKVAAPTFAPSTTPVYNSAQSVTIAASPSDAQIRYTQNGTDPTTTSTLYTGPVSVAVTTTIKARGFKTNWTTSDAGSATYTINNGAVSAGGYHSVALKTDGTVWTWGRNDLGQLDGGYPEPTVPQSTAMSGGSAIAAGLDFTLVMKTDGTVWGFGNNSSGQLGDRSTTSPRYSPVQAYGLAGATGVSAGSAHSLALKSDGTVWAWGLNSNGQVGDGTQTLRNAPTKIKSFTGVTAIAAGQTHSLALKSDGTVWAWGDNWSGQIGKGTSGGNVLAPVQATGLTNVVAIGAGSGSSLAVKRDGTVWAWGAGTTTPTQVAGLANVISVSGGGGYNYAVKQDGTVWGFGPGSSPVQYPVLSGIVQVAATSSGGHVLALGSGGVVWAWGVSTYGQVGDGTTITRPPAVQISEAGFLWKAATPILAPTSGTYLGPLTVRQTTRYVDSVRYTLNGSDPTTSDPEWPPPNSMGTGNQIVLQAGATVKSRSWLSGRAPSNVVSETYALQLQAPQFIGWNTFSATVTLTTVTPGTMIYYTLNGQDPTTQSAWVSSGDTVRVDHPLTLKAVAYKSGWLASAIATRTYSFSMNIVATPTMTPTPGPYASAQQVTLASATAGATIRYTLDGTDPNFSSPIYAGPFTLTDTTTVNARAFKADMALSGLATGTYTIGNAAVATPTISPGTGRYATAQVITIASATLGAEIHYTTTGLEPTLSDPTIASGSTVTVDKSVRLKAKAWLTGAASGVRTADYWLTGAVSAGYYFSMALKTDGTVWTWGNNTSGELGDGTTNPRYNPGPVPGLSNVKAISAGGFHAVALRSDGTVWTWGGGTNGKSPGQVIDANGRPLTNVIAVAASLGEAADLALKSDGTVWTFTTGGPVGSPGPVGPYTLDGGGTGGFTSIATGRDHFLKLKTDGAPSGVVSGSGWPGLGALTDAVAVAAGQYYSLAIRSDGTVWGTGTNVTGQLGVGTSGNSYSTAVKAAGLTRTSTLAAGLYHTLALDVDGSIWATGYDGSGQLGDGYFGSTRTSFGRLSSPTGMVGIAAGYWHSLALRRDGTVWTWGDNTYGQLGSGVAGGYPPVSRPTQIASFSLVDNTWFAADPDGDGLSTFQELQLGTDPYNPDTNGDGIPDGIEVQMGMSPTNTDMDGDGVLNAVEIARGTDPYRADTDGDGVPDGADCFPLDPTRSECPTPTSGDTTPPVIALTEPTNAELINSTTP